MFIDHTDMENLQESLRRFHMKRDILAANLYQNLYSDAPDAVGLFSADLKDHPEKALEAIYAVVILLQGNAESERMVQTLKMRRSKHSVTPRDYEQIAPAFNKSLHQVFRDTLPKEIHTSWQIAFLRLGQILFDDEGASTSGQNA